MPPLYCTLAIGKPYWRYARYLADDLADFGHKIVILTDGPGYFRSCKNALVQEFRPPVFHFNLKCHSHRAAIALAESIVMVDADSAISESNSISATRSSLHLDFAPGLHTWQRDSTSQYRYPEIEKIAQEWGLNFDLETVTYQERIIALRRDGREKQFLDLWEKFGEELYRRVGLHTGDGTVMAICAQAVGLATRGDSNPAIRQLGSVFIPIRHRYPMGFDLRPLRKFRARRKGWPTAPTTFSP
jgi:hypothetical protein